MSKNHIFHSFWLREGLKLLVWEAVLVALAWLLYRNVSWMKHLFFNDVLLLFGAMELAAASFGMLRSPFGVMGAAGMGQGVPALPVQASAEEQRYQETDEITEKNIFAIRLGISGLLTILLAAVL